jgi:hypothetical protein
MVRRVETFPLVTMSHAIRPRGIGVSLSLDKLAFSCDALMRFIGVLNTIFRLVVAWELFDHFKNDARHIPTRPEANDLSNSEFVGHRFLAFQGRITAGHLNSIDVSRTVARGGSAVPRFHVRRLDSSNRTKQAFEPSDFKNR